MLDGVIAKTSSPEKLALCRSNSSGRASIASDCPRRRRSGQRRCCRSGTSFAVDRHRRGGGEADAPLRATPRSHRGRRPRRAGGATARPSAGRSPSPRARSARAETRWRPPTRGPELRLPAQRQEGEPSAPERELGVGIAGRPLDRGERARSRTAGSLPIDQRGYSGSTTPRLTLAAKSSPVAAAAAAGSMRT